MQPHKCLQQLIKYVNLYKTLPYVTDRLLPFGKLRHVKFLLVCMAVRFGAQGCCAKVMYSGLPYVHCI